MTGSYQLSQTLTFISIYSLPDTENVIVLYKNFHVIMSWALLCTWIELIITKNHPPNCAALKHAWNKLLLRVRLLKFESTLVTESCGLGYLGIPSCLTPIDTVVFAETPTPTDLNASCLCCKIYYYSALKFTFFLKQDLKDYYFFLKIILR